MISPSKFCHLEYPLFLRPLSFFLLLHIRLRNPRSAQHIKMQIKLLTSIAPAAVQDAVSRPLSPIAQLASATTTPDWFSKVPTSVANNKAKQDFNNYISSAAAQPEGKSFLEAVYAAAPTEVQSLYGDPMGVVVALEASATPVWTP